MARKVKLNEADRRELMKLDGVNASTADRIITYREEHDGIGDFEELRSVPGITRNTLDSIRNQAKL